MSRKQKEYQVIIVNPKRCTNCETCMEICAFIHGNKYVPLNKRIIGMRMRIELEWAISCDMCKGMKEEYINSEVEKTPQCISVCPKNAIFISTLESFGDESRNEAINRVFKNH